MGPGRAREADHARPGTTTSAPQAAGRAPVPLVRHRHPTSAPHPPPHPTTARTMSLDPIVSRSLLALAVGVALILLGIALAPPA